MIDLKTLEKWEQDAADYGLRGYADAFRLASRYLALRERGVLMGLPFKMRLVSDDDLDAAADRLLDGGE